MVELVALILLGHDLLSLFELSLEYHVNKLADISFSVYSGSHFILMRFEVKVEATELGLGPTLEDGAAHVEFGHGFRMLLLNLSDALIIILAVQHCEERRRYALDGGCAGLVVDQRLLSERMPLL